MKHLFCLIFLVFSCLPGQAQPDTCLNYLTLGISFPPVADSVQRNFTKPHLDALNVTKIRFAENWDLREPAPGNFNWGPLDKRMDWAHAHNYEVLMTIQSNGPAWACSATQNAQSCVFLNNNDFRNYVDALLLRYPGKIDKLQFGNEWQSDFWYAGNAGEFIAAHNVLYNSVKTHSPSTQVVLGGFTAISLRFMAGCNGAVSSFYDDDAVFYDPAFLAANCPTPVIQNVLQRIDSVLRFAQYDMLDIHLYDDAEQWDEYYLNFADTITKPIIVSEFGGPNLNLEPYTPAYQADRLHTYIEKLDSLQIEEAYFFKLVEGSNNPAHAKSGLIDGLTLMEKPAYAVFSAFSNSNCLTPLDPGPQQEKFSLYPNPMQEYVRIVPGRHFSTEKYTLRILDQAGMRVRKIEAQVGEELLLERGNLRRGMYFVQLADRQGRTETRKLLVE